MPFQFPTDIDPDCVDAKETQRIAAKYRSPRPRNIKPKNRIRTVTLPELRCIAGWKPSKPSCLQER
jgi:hypothetical protein